MQEKKNSRQETPNSVGGTKKIMYYNVVDDVNVADVVDDNGEVDDDVDDDGDDDDDDDDDDDGDGDEGDDNEGDDDDDDGDGDDDDVDVEEEEEEEDDDVEVDDVEEGDRSQDREAHFVRACAVEMYTNISQEPFCMDTYRTNDRGHLWGHRFVRACAVEMHMDTSQKPFCVEIYRENAGRESRDTRTCHKRHFVRKFTAKMPGPYPAASILCEPAQSKCTWTCH